MGNIVDNKEGALPIILVYPTGYDFYGNYICEPDEAKIMIVVDLNGNQN